jgi:hypothetical protein
LPHNFDPPYKPQKSDDLIAELAEVLKKPGKQDPAQLHFDKLDEIGRALDRQFRRPPPEHE